MKISGKDWMITSCEQKVSQKSSKKYLSIKIMDDAGGYGSLLDWDLEHEEYYKQGKRADFTINLYYDFKTKYLSLTVLDFVLKKESDH